MTVPAPRSSDCPDCSAPHDPLDNYCRHCGIFLRDYRLPVATATATPTVVEPRRPALPARMNSVTLPEPVRRAATAIAIGTALKIVANLLGRVLAYRSARQASSRALARRRTSTVVRESLFVRRTWSDRD